MELPEQPPPDVPAPPPGPEALRSRRVMRIILWIGALCLLPFVGIILLGLLLELSRNPKSSARAEAINNLRQIGLALFEFDAEYGQFPDTSTIAAVKRHSGTLLTLNDSSSNMLFRQLIANGLKSEKPFWVKIPATPKAPDNLYSTDAEALAPGECSFAYISGITSSITVETPIVMMPLEKGKTSFDRSAFDGKALFLFLDNSVRALPIEKDGRVLINGMDIFDPRQPFWKGKAPQIRWQE